MMMQKTVMDVVAIETIEKRASSLRLTRRAIAPPLRFRLSYPTSSSRDPVRLHRGVVHQAHHRAREEAVQEHLFLEEDSQPAQIFDLPPKISLTDVSAAYPSNARAQN